VLITIGSRVSMHFSLALADGMPVESSYGDEPVTFVVGDGSVDKGLELALIGLRSGDKQVLTLMPGQAFGQRHSEAVQWIPRARFPRDMQPEPGQIIGFSGENGEEMPGAVLEVAADRVRIDFNHPLAGREIVFDVHILAVENPMEQGAGDAGE
jgi:FKBP-type peptidyl-prolyl cis-trans isomerase SlpA